MAAYRLVLSAAALATVLTAALIAALVAFTGQALSQAAHRQLAAAPSTSIRITGQASAGQSSHDTTVIRAQLRAAFGASGFALYRAEWSSVLGLPARYAKDGTPVTEAGAFPAITAHAVLRAGHWPGPPRPGQPLPVALPAAAAALLHLSPGDTVLLRDQTSSRPLRVAVAGVFQPSTGPYWGLNRVGANGVSRQGGFATYGPLVVNQAAFGTVLTASQASWAAQPVTRDIPDGAMASLPARISADEQALASLGTSGGLQTSSALPALLTAIASNLVVARSLLVVAAIQLVLLAGFALASVASLLATDREGESALLAARGGSRWQLTTLTIPEVTLLAVLAAAVGGLAGGWLADLLAHAGPLQAAGLRLQGLSWGVAAAIALTAAFAALIMLGPVLRTITPGAARVRRGRQVAIAGLARSGADLALVVLAALAVWQLHYSLIVAPSASGTLGINPVLVLAPALAVAGGTVILVRLLPLAASGCDRLASRGRRLPLSLASWEVSRHPLRQASVALLVVMAVATGTLALAEHASWQRSATDQAAFSAGADVRVTIPPGTSFSRQAAVAGTPGVSHAMAAAQANPGGQDQLLALDARQAAHVVLLRHDQSARPAPALFAAITPHGPAPGLALPGHPRAVSITVSLGPAGVRLGPFVAAVTVTDAEGGAEQLSAGTLPADGRPHVLTVTTGGQGLPAAAYPLRLTSLTLNYTLPIRQPGAALLRVIRVAEPTAGWSAPGTALASWSDLASSGELDGVVATNGSFVAGSADPAVRSVRAGPDGSQAVSFFPGYGEEAPPPYPPGLQPSRIGGQLNLVPRPQPLPVIATRAFAASHHAGPGTSTQVSVGGTGVPVRITAIVPAFPTIPAGTSAVVADLTALQNVIVNRLVPPLPVTQWWLATAGAVRPPGLAGRLPAGSAVTTSAGRATSLLGDPVSAVAQQGLLAIGVAAALLAITGFGVSIAAGVSQRRAQTALLGALGVGRGAQARQLCLAELMLSVPSAAVGLLLGALLSRLFVPATTLSTGATKPYPPVLTEIPWPLAGMLALAVAVAPVVAAAASSARHPDPAAALRTAEAT
ncbi:MAG TPA: FtsX-like permease family protein [Streptosporangiaceae bacterium]